MFVVRWGHTRQEAVIEALKQIVDAQGDVAGVVMSRVVSKQYRQYSYGDPFFESPAQRCAAPAPERDERSVRASCSSPATTGRS